MIDVATLQRIDLFQYLKPESLMVLTQNLRPLHLEAGEMLITENSETRGPLFIIVRGELEVSRRDRHGQPHPITVLTPPTVVGEMEFLADLPSSASVKALGELEGMVLPRDRFEALFEVGEPVAYQLALAIARTLSHRLAATNALLTKALSDAPDRLRTVAHAQFDNEALSAVDQELEELLAKE